ncbi:MULTISPECIES: hypothetical protein [unclassified Spirulina]|uniref:hypothetical protein n=1 Tax=unclassified Spirulina TaxID=2684457 RepID=UPI00194FA1FE|nr:MULTISPECIES: hypothetical protein [Spirulina]MEA5470554.1 hypothetical protein [Spirulina sp. 06S082]
MSSENIATVVKMLESLPDELHEQAIAHLREYLADLQDELEWDRLVEKTRPQLIRTAIQAKQEIAEGKATPMDYDRL